MRLKRAAILLFLALWPSPAPAKCELESVGRALATRHLVPAALSAESVRKVPDGLVIQGKNQQFLVSSKVIDSPNPWLAKTDVKRITFEVRTTTGDLAGDGHVEVLNGRFGDIGIDVNGFQRQGIGKAIFQKLFDVAPRGMVLRAGPRIFGSINCA